MKIIIYLIIRQNKIYEVTHKRGSYPIRWLINDYKSLKDKIINMIDDLFYANIVIR